ncbi:uncharacterized protein JCM15063_002735 [Sporobolomyces koalae]|uniref:uncharacterized protein n=1 Tax=Sporobolomyces koalae TaxID=500713 RepID=UPI0031712BA6
MRLAAFLSSLSSVLFFSCAAGQQLADGTYFQSGSINPNLMWQASGTLSHGRCPFAVKISDCYTSNLGAVGNLQSATNPASRYRRDLSAYNPAKGDKIWAAMSLAERRAASNDDDLESYFQAFPDQAPAQVNRLASRRTFLLAATLADSLLLPCLKGKRQVATCSTRVTSSSTTSSGSTPTTSATTTTTAAPTVTPKPDPPIPRQRNELLTWPGARAGTTWKYTWKSYQSLNTGTTSLFFHAWQILRRDACGGPVITLDYTNGEVRIQDFVRGCYSCVQPLAAGIHYWFGKTISHTLTITYGLSGSMTYTAYSDSNLRRPLLTYSAKGDMGSSTSLKFGNYRGYSNELTNATAYIGDLVSTQLS